MSEEYLKTIFDPFTREEKSGTNHVQGTGLGMAITKRVVNLMGGIIRVESTPGHGSRFEVVLEFPIDTAAEQAACDQAAPEAEKGVSPLDGMRFLCAEDNLINAEILEMLLESKGASCKICANGQEIVDTFAGVQPGEYSHGRANAGDGRPGGSPPHPQRRKSPGQNHPHPCPNRQRLFGGYAEKQGCRHGRASIQAR